MTYHLDGYLPTPIRIPEWDIELRHTSSDDEDVEAFRGTLDLGRTGWLGEITYLRFAPHVGEERERYEFRLQGVLIDCRKEWFAPGDAFPALLAEIEKWVPAADKALRVAEDAVAMRREHAKTHEDDERAYREEGVRT